jgi:hypothetical protein
MSDPATTPDIVCEAYGTVTLPDGWHYDDDGNPIQDNPDDDKDD